ncbi:hypothetical protein V8G54_031721 [Vigna mungo]|uniref:Protein FAR1-RELATED SEQUENCE n=1 Tax=Vigna mungo TaxID=3915 RepID=A0AAQ3MKY8_VIGMU
MTDDTMCSPSDKDLSLSPNLDITVLKNLRLLIILVLTLLLMLVKCVQRGSPSFEKMAQFHWTGVFLAILHSYEFLIDDGSPNSEQLLDIVDEGNELDNECGQLFEIDENGHENGRDETRVVDSHSGESQGKDCPPPVVGMEFDTYDDAYNYYNTYAKEIGFATRVKSSWTKRNSKEKRGAVLCCNCEGFKTTKDANSHRKETRTGCLAMIRLRLVESNRWRVDEVKLEHNHSFDPERAQNSKSHKRMDTRSKRKVEPTLDVEFQEYEAFQIALTKVIYDSKTVDEFERAWDDLTQHFGIRNHEKILTLHEEREHWAPVYSKDTFFAGISDYEKGESVVPFFKGHVHQQTSLKEFFEIYELVQQKKHKTEVLDDLESCDLSSILKTRCYYELQISKLYTNAVFRKFQDEVMMMSSCFSITQTQTSGSTVTYMVKEREVEDPATDSRHFEVMYDKAGTEVRCICSCFNFKGYLCRHALYILNFNGVEEIPCQYILSRWRKDFKRLYVPHLSADNVDISNPVQCFDHLYKRAMRVVEEGMISQDHYMVSWQAFKESLNKIRLVADKIE